jgi:hypothetical protein
MKANEVAATGHAEEDKKGEAWGVLHFEEIAPTKMTMANT